MLPTVSAFLTNNVSAVPNIMEQFLHVNWGALVKAIDVVLTLNKFILVFDSCKYNYFSNNVISN